MDHDTYSANDAIGKVNISLNPLLLPNLDTSGQVIQSGKGYVSMLLVIYMQKTNALYRKDINLQCDQKCVVQKLIEMSQRR